MTDVSVIAADGLWMEGAAIQQLHTTAVLPGMHRVVGQPDLHPGRGYPIGAAFFSVGCLYPALVGNDIGCGMGLWQTDLSTHKVKLDKLDRLLGNMDDGIVDREWASLEAIDGTVRARAQELADELKIIGLNTAHLESLGSLGGGNHFFELQVIDQVIDPSLLPAGVRPKELQLLVHTGSRGLGQVVLRAHVDAFGHGGLIAGTDQAAAYLRQHAAAVRYAKLNREVFALRVACRLRCAAQRILDVNHNTVTEATVDGLPGFLHRKGASPSDEGPVMLPGSRGDHSYLLQPIPSELSLNSVAHGAGRKWARADCKGRLFKFAGELDRTQFGSRVICNNKELMFEEAPQAYKSVDGVLDSLVAAGFAQAIYRSRPVLTYKTRGECCS